MEVMLARWVRALVVALCGLLELLVEQCQLCLQVEYVEIMEVAKALENGCDCLPRNHVSNICVATGCWRWSSTAILYVSLGLRRIGHDCGTR